MALTEEMRKWNQWIEEEMNKTQDMKYLDSFPKETQEI